MNHIFFWLRYGSLVWAVVGGVDDVSCLLLGRAACYPKTRGLTASQWPVFSFIFKTPENHLVIAHCGGY